LLIFSASWITGTPDMGAAMPMTAGMQAQRVMARIAGTRTIVMAIQVMTVSVMTAVRKTRVTPPAVLVIAAIQVMMEPAVMTMPVH
jgi:hypothetical protein